jgi:catechol 2,3-dioxygenase-like lactoylglutathione lyase family enzyme
MEIIQPLHTAILVSHQERAEHFYGEVLGLTKVDRPFSFAGTWYQIGNFQIHLIVDSGLELKLNNAEKWGRNAHIALAVKDLDAAKAKLAAAGCAMQASASGRAALFTQDPDGNVIELSAG